MMASGESCALSGLTAMSPRSFLCRAGTWQMYGWSPTPIARWPPPITAIRRTSASQSHQCRLPIHHFRGRERRTARMKHRATRRSTGHPVAGPAGPSAVNGQVAVPADGQSAGGIRLLRTSTPLFQHHVE